MTSITQMREAHPAERTVGLTWYVSDSDGTGGRIKANPSDFVVRELESVELHPVTADQGDYPHLIIRVRLRDWDTFAFAKRLGSELGCHPDAIRWAGTKDKAAHTTQLISIAKASAESVPTISGADIEPVGRFGRPLGFGDLHGNAFTIRVAEPPAPSNHHAITDELAAFGGGIPAVPNYFGIQRFGSVRPITHEVGLAIIAEDWEQAVMTYLGQSSEAEPADTRAAREFVSETRDWETARDRFPRRLDHERVLCDALVDSAETDEDAFRCALDALPYGLRQLFVHAAQSFLFNRILSARLEAGLPVTEAVPGDVVCFSTDGGPLGRVPDPDKTQRVSQERLATVNRHVANGRAFVTAPLVGTETTLADGKPGRLERAVLDSADIGPTDFDLPEPYDSRGIRRALLVRPTLNIEPDPLTFSFSLPSGSYATVVLREYLKVPPDAMR